MRCAEHEKLILRLAFLCPHSRPTKTSLEVLDPGLLIVSVGIVCGSVVNTVIFEHLYVQVGQRPCCKPSSQNGMFLFVIESWVLILTANPANYRSPQMETWP